MSTAAHTPGPMIVMFGAQNCSLHLAARGGDTNAKNRILQLPRDGSKGDADPNVRFLRTLAAAPELLEALVELVRRADAECQPGARAAGYREARTAIARATGGAS